MNWGERRYMAVLITLVLIAAMPFLQGCPPQTWQEVEAAAPITSALWERVPGPWGWDQREECYWRLRTPTGWVLRETTGEAMFVPDPDGTWLRPTPEAQ